MDLTSGTTLILDSGTHIIPTGPACYLTDLSNVAITTSSNATVQCTGERMFHFRYAELYDRESRSLNAASSRRCGCSLKSHVVSRLILRFLECVDERRGDNEVQRPCGPGFMLSNDYRVNKLIPLVGSDCFKWSRSSGNNMSTDYCNSKDRAINLQSPNSICNGGREGVLCGRCPAGQSVVFGSPECHLCSDLWLITLVTQGTIYGLIFYANIIVVNSTVFFGGLDLKFLQVIISFIILDLGFPLCFYNGRTMQQKWAFSLHFQPTSFFSSSYS
eukprot:Em0477g3a